MVEIRQEAPGDIAAIRDVNRRAFGQEQEGRIVDAIRDNGAARLSLVAVDHGRIVGHILYSPARIGELEGAALGPMAVAPEAQRQGIGTKLVEDGNARLAASGCPFIVVVGHPEFYPRFGFTPASGHGITCAWDVPDDVFMVRIVDAGRMAGVSGPAMFRPEFSTIE